MGALITPERQSASGLKGLLASRSDRMTPLEIDWVIPGKLALGRAPQVADIEVLAKYEIRVILSLCYPQECRLSPQFQLIFRQGYVSLPDSCYRQPLSPQRILQAALVIHRSVSRHLPIYVHCREGIERSPLICMTYLCLYRHVSLPQAMRWLKDVHPASAPTSTQLRVLRECLLLAKGGAAV
ncbi:MAG: dual specificity protein phosphatase family protein [Synechococcaceae cyanobacterium SM2_3_1]|nr:dual specificity protein phosphatase family protein [Synechococcaceae cyanobacterium SM2_3_1]